MPRPKRDPLDWFPHDVAEWATMARILNPAHLGHVMTLRGIQWRDGLLPDDLRAIAGFLCLTWDDFADAWSETLSKVFRATEGGYADPAFAAKREEQIARYQSKVEHNRQITAERESKREANRNQQEPTGTNRLPSGTNRNQNKNKKRLDKSNLDSSEPIGSGEESPKTEPTEPYRSIEQILIRVGEAMETGPPTRSEVTRHLAPTSHLRQLMDKYESRWDTMVTQDGPMYESLVDFISKLYIFACQHRGMGIDWKTLWENNAPIANQMHHGVKWVPRQPSVTKPVAPNRVDTMEAADAALNRLSSLMGGG